MNDLKPTIIIDNGSYTCKAGLADDYEPSSFRAILGRPKTSSKTQQLYVVDEAQAMKGELNLKFPVENGIVNNWDDMERIWHHAFFNQLRVAPEEHPTLITDRLKNTRNEREQMAIIMFESFQVPQFYISNSLGSILCATGRESGVVVDSGHQMTEVVCLVDYFYVQNTYKFSKIGGEACSEYLMKNPYRSFPTPTERVIVSNMKNTLSYVALNYKSEQANQIYAKRNYELPDGNLLSVGNERFECTEVLFNPELVGIQSLGIHQMIQSSVDEIKDIVFKRRFMKDIIFSGGNSLIRNIQERLQNEITYHFYPRSFSKLVNHYHFERQYLALTGAMIQSQIIRYQGLMISKQDYNDCGASVVQRHYKGINHYY